MFLPAIFRGRVNHRKEIKMKGMIIAIVCFTGMVIGFGYIYKTTQAKMRQYEIEHNCRYDYNDLCYTREQRPWLYVH